MASWDPIVLGIEPKEVERALSRALSDAQRQGVPNAGNARITVGPADARDDGGLSSKVIIHGLDDHAAQSLWNQHLEPALGSLKDE